MRMKKVYLSVGAIAMMLASPALAATKVSVELIGERGGNMSIKLDKNEVPAGEVTFDVVNAAMQTPHEMVVIKLDKAGQKLEIDPDKNRVDEAKLNSMGEVSDLKAGKGGTLTVNLEPGSYELICNLKGHVAAGMVVPFTVAK